MAQGIKARRERLAALTRSPDASSRCFYDLCVFLEHESRDLSAAVDTALAAVKRWPRNEFWHYHRLADLYIQLGNYDAAIAATLHSLQWTPEPGDRKWAWERIAEAELASGRPERSEAARREAAALRLSYRVPPEHVLLRLAAAEVHRLVKNLCSFEDYALSLRVLDAWLRGQGNSGGGHWELLERRAFALRNLGHPGEASIVLYEALACEPPPPPASQFRVWGQILSCARSLPDERGLLLALDYLANATGGAFHIGQVQDAWALVLGRLPGTRFERFAGSLEQLRRDMVDFVMGQRDLHWQFEAWNAQHEAEAPVRARLAAARVSSSAASPASSQPPPGHAEAAAAAGGSEDDGEEADPEAGLVSLRRGLEADLEAVYEKCRLSLLQLSISFRAAVLLAAEPAGGAANGGAEELGRPGQTSGSGEADWSKELPDGSARAEEDRTEGDIAQLLAITQQQSEEAKALVDTAIDLKRAMAEVQQERALHAYYKGFVRCFSRSRTAAVGIAKQPRGRIDFKWIGAVETAICLIPGAQLVGGVVLQAAKIPYEEAVRARASRIAGLAPTDADLRVMVRKLTLHRILRSQEALMKHARAPEQQAAARGLFLRLLGRLQAEVEGRLQGADPLRPEAAAVSPDDDEDRDHPNLLLGFLHASALLAGVGEGLLEGLRTEQDKVARLNDRLDQVVIQHFGGEMDHRWAEMLQPGVAPDSFEPPEQHSSALLACCVVA